MCNEEKMFIKGDTGHGQQVIQTQNERVIAVFDKTDRWEDACLELCLKALNDAPPPIDTQDELSEAQHAEHKIIRDYINNSGHCPMPKCKSKDVNYQQSDFEGDRISTKVICDDCGAEWLDIHTLNNIKITDRGNSEKDKA